MEVCQRIAGFRATHARLLCYTLLSFLAKFGASIPDREILGGHTGRMKSVLTYSRDSLASPLRVLNNMLEHTTRILQPERNQIGNDDGRCQS